MEDEKEFHNELKMLQLLNDKKAVWGLKSIFPKPLGICSLRKAIAFTVSRNYYDYVSGIENEKDFQEAMTNIAFDLGILLRIWHCLSSKVNVFHSTGQLHNVSVPFKVCYGEH